MRIVIFLVKFELDLVCQNVSATNLKVKGT